MLTKYKIATQRPSFRLTASSWGSLAGFPRKAHPLDIFPSRLIKLRYKNKSFCSICMCCCEACGLDMEHNRESCPKCHDTVEKCITQVCYAGVQDIWFTTVTTGANVYCSINNVTNQCILAVATVASVIMSVPCAPCDGFADQLCSETSSCPGNLLLLLLLLCIGSSWLGKGVGDLQI